MQQEKIQKIKILVQTSTLLNTAEREDWMNLLELMNDKQILELEKILSYKAPTQTPSSQNSAAPLSLSHIMNFPTNIPPAQPSPSVQKPSVSKEPIQPAISKFGQWLKKTVEEKELPAGQFEQALPAVIVKQPLEIKKQEVIKAPVKPVVEQPKVLPKPKPPTLPVIKPFPLIAKTQLPKTPEIKQTVSLPEKMTPEKFAEAGFEKARMPVSSIASIIDGPKKQDFRKSGLLNFPQNFSESSAGFQKPGEQAKKPPISETAKAPSKTADVLPVPKPPKPSNESVRETHPAHSPATQKTTMVKEVGILSGITLEQYRASGPQAFAETLGGGIKGFGYHKAVVALEHSPLYSVYINTGLKILSEGSSFEDLSGSPEEKNKYFSRQEFEKFTDLLRQVPATV